MALTLSVDVERRLGAFRVAARFEAGPGITVLFGRSGAGKTSLVDMIAGLLRPDAGRIAVGDAVLFDSAANIDLPPHRRGVGYVFQDSRLFPHLSVRQNLLYGRWFAGFRTGTGRQGGAALDAPKFVCDLLLGVPEKLPKYDFALFTGHFREYRIKKGEQGLKNAVLIGVFRFKKQGALYRYPLFIRCLLLRDKPSRNSNSFTLPDIFTCKLGIHFPDTHCDTYSMDLE